MDKSKFLSGYDLVTRGTTNIDGSLPKIGLKDVLPNGSWLEQKQIQSALEARKHLIEVERIEKSGTISHAEWREELMLAEVTRNVGGCWQFIGHNVGKQMFLNPEEALFLMEVNCLQLKYNGVTVSLQQAYSLLLRGKVSPNQYKVYSSLSKMGYKVFRCMDLNSTDYEKKIDLTHHKNIEVTTVVLDTDDNVKENNGLKETDTNMQIDNDIDNVDTTGTNSNTEIIVNKEIDEHENNMDLCSSNADIMELDNASDANDLVNKNSSYCTETAAQESNHQIGKKISVNLDRQLHALESRKLKPCNSDLLQKYFKCIPEILQNLVVTVEIPSEDHIPKNVFLNNRTYVLNIERIKTNIKDVRPPSTNSRTYSIPEEVNGAHVKRVKDSALLNTPQCNWPHPFQANTRFRPTFNLNTRFTGPRPYVNFRPFQFWRPHMDFYNPNWSFQRAFMPNFNFMPRFNFFPRPPIFGPIPNLVNLSTRSRKRKRQVDRHLVAIKKLANRLKDLMRRNLPQERNKESLEILIDTFNSRYGRRLRLSEQFDIIEDTMVETIEIDCDEESSRKKSRSDRTEDKYEEYLIKLKQLAFKLKELELKNKANTRHKRALSSVIKKFNKSYNADVYMNTNYEVLDRRHITLDSSSDSDCVIEEIQKPMYSKKLRNPFNVLKRLSEKPNSSIDVPSTSKEGTDPVVIVEHNNTYSEFITETFGSNWLPKENDFGRAEVFPRNLMYSFLIDCKKAEYLYGYINDQPHGLNNWTDIKISYLKNVAIDTAEYEKEVFQQNTSGLNSIIRSEDSTDMLSVMQKLSIIPANNEISSESSLKIHFDVYNRDIQNFKKTNRPKPHFRVICMDESSSFPSGAEIAALHSKFDDNVIIMFAIVGDASVSYLQINPTNLPVYLRTTDMND